MPRRANPLRRYFRENPLEVLAEGVWVLSLGTFLTAKSFVQLIDSFLG